MTDTQSPYIILTLRFFKENEQWLGECLELGIGTYGDVLETVLGELPKLLEQHISAIKDNGDLDSYLLKNNLQLSTDKQPVLFSLSVPYISGSMYKPFLYTLHNM